MDSGDKLAIVRAAYAKQVLSAVSVDDPRIEAAFARVPREDYMGPGPWPIVRGYRVYEASPSSDPVHLYRDNLVGLAPEREINNGLPSFHAYLLACSAPAEGEHIVHVGSGTGYYTAIMADLVGSSGRVTAIEFDSNLAARAKAYLSPLKNVHVVEGDGARVPFDPADVIYVNAGTTQPAEAWLDRLAEGGRLVLPLTTDEGFSTFDLTAMRGSVFLIGRRGQEYTARWISPVAIFPCVGNRDQTSERALTAAFAAGRWQEVTRLYRHNEVPDDGCWLRGDGWCLAYD